ncbi:MAG: hypothetical protein AMXMBFR46_07380 [Acidimicrobiia bacterium]
MRLADAHAETTVARQRAPARDRHDAPLLQEGLDPLGVLVDHGLLARLRDPEVERRLTGAHAELGCAPHRAQHLGGLEEVLRGDAALVQARPADALLLDDGDLQPGRPPVQRGGVAARTATQHHQVELVCHGCSSGRGPAAHCRSLGSARRPPQPPALAADPWLSAR